MRFLPWIMALMWLVARYTAGQFMTLENAKNFGVLSNVLLILILIFLSIFFKYRSFTGERPSFFEDVKGCMKSAIKYVIAVVVAIGIYYAFLSDDVRTIREAQINTFSEMIASDDGLATFKAQHPEVKDKSREELNTTNKENVERFVSVQSQMLGGLVALTFVSFVYTLLAVFFWRAVVKRI